MHFFRKYTDSFQIIIFLVIVFALSVASASLCPSLTGSLNCNCDVNKIECSGNQTNASEIQDILANFSSVSNVVIQVASLHFEPTFQFENMSIQNLTLGYGLENPPPDFFSKLGASLLILNLNNNSIQNINDQLFLSLSSLTELHLDFNELVELESSMLENLNSLEYLTIASNDFNKVSCDAFQSLPSLHTLVLSHNSISEFKNVNIKSSYLAVLKLEGCIIGGALDNDTLADLPNLEELNLSHNRLSEIKPYSLSLMKNLQSLNLSFNVIEFLQENAFSNLSNLISLDLKANKISLIKTTAFVGLISLKYLDLSVNKLKAVLCDYTLDFDALEIIYLQDNEIKSFTAGAFYYSPMLKELGLEGNNLECSCELTDTAHHLIENSTMSKSDFDSVFCIVTSTLGHMPIIDYKNSKCVPEQPCKKPSLNDDDDYDYDEATTALIFFAASTANYTTLVSTTSGEISTQNVISPVTSTKITFESTASAEDFAISETAVYDSTPVVTTVIADLGNESSTTEATTSANSSDSTINGVSSTDPVIAVVSNTQSTIEPTENTTITFSTSPQLTTLPVSDPAASTSDPSTSTSDPTTSTFYTTTTTLSDTIPSKLSDSDSTTTMLSTSNVASSTTSEKSSTNAVSEKIPTIASTSNGPCSDLELSLDRLNSDYDTGVLKNFSYDGTTFCLKWTLGSVFPPKSRCMIKYTFIGGTKSKNLNCPTFPGDVKLWSINVKVFKFCLKFIGGNMSESCVNKIESATTLGVTNMAVTISSITSSSTFTSTEATTFSTEEAFGKSTTISSTGTTDAIANIMPSSALTSIETSTFSTEKVTESGQITTTEKYVQTDPSTSTFIVTENTKEITKVLKVDDKTAVIVPAVHPSTFNITSIDLYFNDSSFAYVKWTVNIAEPQNICNLTLTVTTQYFDHNEGTFPCKKHTHRLLNVMEDEIFKLCLVSQHQSSGNITICRYSLAEANIDTAASNSGENTNHSSSLIPLICLLILLVFIIIFIIVRNTLKKKQDSDRYDVRAEEEKSQRVMIRPTSSVDRSSLRYSYIAKENPDS